MCARCGLRKRRLTRGFVDSRCVKPILDLIQEAFYKRGLLKSCSKEASLPGVYPVQFMHVQGEIYFMYSKSFFVMFDPLLRWFMEITDHHELF